MIPKIIHYIWFGGDEVPEDALICIASWRKYCPDYEIHRWDESNFDVNCCPYVFEAYKAEKWAFVSDYARFWILYKYGGVYLDTDVELIKSIDDIIDDSPFMGFETDPKPFGEQSASNMAVAPGLGLAASPGLNLYREVIDSYEQSHFIRPNGSLDLTTVVERITAILTHHGLRAVPGIQNICGVSIYPAEYFNPTNLVTGKVSLTSNTRSIHHYSASWLPESLKAVGIYQRDLARRLPWLPKILRSGLAWGKYSLKTGDFKSIIDHHV